MNTIINGGDTPTQETFKKVATEFLAAGSSVFAYHPFKTIGQQIFTGTLNLNPKALFEGFLGSALAAHQLFLMGTLDGFLKKIFKAKNPTEFQQMGIGALAGALTTFTVTPCEMMAIQKQNKKPIIFNTLLRGFEPLVLRQAGLGAGMLGEHEGASSLTVGAITAAMTQIFEQARVMMQNDPFGEKYPNAKTALQKAPIEMLSEKGRKMFAIRLATIAIATLVLGATREAYPKYFFNKENIS